jgi:hypothetical protein
MTTTLTKKPVIELKNIKHTAWASQETHCYQATLYVDGVKWGIVSNEGHGGGDTFYGVDGYNWDDLAELNKRIAETYEPYTYGGKSLDQNLEMVCGDLVNQWLRDKDFNRAMKAKVLFTKPDTQGVWQLAVKKPHTLETTLAALRSRNPQYTYLADLPVDKAKAIYFA